MLASALCRFSLLSLACSNPCKFIEPFEGEIPLIGEELLIERLGELLIER